MQIVIIADPFEKQSAGIHRYTVGMINALADNLPDVKVTAIVSSTAFPNSKVESVFVPHVFSFLKNDPIRKLHKIPRIINRIKPDIVIEPAHFGPLRIAKGIKRVTVIHDLVPVVRPEYSRTISSILQRMFLPGILKKTNVIIANSEFTKETIITKYPFCKEKVHVAYPGTESSLKAGDWDNRFVSGVIPGKYFLHVGTIEPRKNINTLLDAFAIVKKKSNDHALKLVLAGNTGWIKGNFTHHLKKYPYHDSVILTGHVPDEAIQMLYKYAVALVFPSFYEGFGFPLAEAMHHSCPVICSDIRVFHEISGNNALFIDPDSKEELSDNMFKILVNDYTSFIKKKAHLHIQKYSWKNYARSLSVILGV